MRDAPKGLRRHIAVMGRRNAGKSSLLNAICGQEAAIVSDQPGTTTDPVEKTMELEGFGPIVWVDTAGIDDEGSLGQKRMRRSLEIMRRMDAAILVTEGDVWGPWEKELAARMRELRLPFIVARNKTDLEPAAPARNRGAQWGVDSPIVDISAKKGAGIEELLGALAGLFSGGENEGGALLADLVPPGGLVVLVVPLDSGAPKGRLILPQTMAIRDCLDHGRLCLLARPGEYEAALGRLAAKADLVACDSQVLRQVADSTPPEIPLTTFSILMARLKGNLALFARGAGALGKLRPGDRVLVQEACSHHAGDEDIGKVKIPAMLRRLAGGDLDIRFAHGKEITELDMAPRAIVHCGGCVITRRQMLARQELAREKSLPMTNYGMAISLAQGLLERTLGLFPDALRALKDQGE